jgi:DNA-binding transcriptional LysR family regulator
MLDVRKLAALREIATRGSFSAAARGLNYSQSAISQQVAQLEREVGALLIERRGRRIRLTPAGQALADRAGPILRDLREAEAELEAITGLSRGPLRLAVFASAAATVVPPAIARFRAGHPGVAITMTIADSGAAVSQVAKGEADIAIINKPDTFTAGRAVAVCRLLEDPMRVALPLGHRLAERQSLRLSDLSAEPWILATSPSCADWEVFATACRRAGFEPRIAFRNDDYLALQGLVAAGLGVALLPDLATVSVRDDIVLRPLEPGGPVRHVAAVVGAGHCQSPTVEAMLEALHDSAAAYCPAARSAAWPAVGRPAG